MSNDLIKLTREAAKLANRRMRSEMLTENSQLADRLSHSKRRTFVLLTQFWAPFEVDDVLTLRLIEPNYSILYSEGLLDEANEIAHDSIHTALLQNPAFLISHALSEALTGTQIEVEDD